MIKADFARNKVLLELLQHPERKISILFVVH